MSLNELKINQSAKIMRITAGDALRDRLFSLGLLGQKTAKNQLNTRQKYRSHLTITQLCDTS
ncbi:MAG: ferrous iron transport protein A [Campylobacter sp.]|uniref:FeoA family protein n=1 Tax=Campylobacter sp. TaxID=205 RepID=UPI002A747A4C|nr:ferrous iron transport protein A [Campylobacter sp.]MDY3245337.1 ferrous iron transport protein A [Campylobacter sp.]MDY4830275.1 ferrous iron transport protein A [Campylobacter sp.]